MSATSYESRECTVPQRPLRILVVDDDDGCRQSISTLLLADGHEIWTASRGVEALETVRIVCGKSARLDLTILDVNMPDLNGIETYRRLLWELPGLEAVFVSGDPSSLVVEEVRHLGARALLRKPLDVARVRRIVRRVMLGGEFEVC